MSEPKYFRPSDPQDFRPSDFTVNNALFLAIPADEVIALRLLGVTVANPRSLAVMCHYGGYAFYPVQSAITGAHGYVLTTDKTLSSSLPRFHRDAVAVVEFINAIAAPKDTPEHGV